MLRKLVNSGTKVQNPTHVFHYGLVRGLELMTHTYLLATLMMSDSEEEFAPTPLSRKVQELFLIFSTFTLLVKEIKPGLNEPLKHYADRFLMNPLFKPLFSGVRLYAGIICLAETIYSTLTLNPQGFLQGAYGLITINTPFAENMANAVKETLDRHDTPQALTPYLLGALRLGLHSGVPYLIRSVVPRHERPIFPQVHAAPTQDLHEAVRQNLQKFCKETELFDCIFHFDTTNQRLVINIPIIHLPHFQSQTPYFEEKTVTLLEGISESVPQGVKVLTYVEGLTSRVDIYLHDSADREAVSLFYDFHTQAVLMQDGSLQSIVPSLVHHFLYGRLSFNFPKLPSNILILPGEFSGDVTDLTLSEWRPSFEQLSEDLSRYQMLNHTDTLCHTSEFCQEVLCQSETLLLNTLNGFPVWYERDAALYRDLEARSKLDGPDNIFVVLRGSTHFLRDESFYSNGEATQAALTIYAKNNKGHSNSGPQQELLNLVTSDQYKDVVKKSSRVRSFCDFTVSTFEEMRDYLHNAVFRPVHADFYFTRLITALLREQAQKAEQCFIFQKKGGNPA